MLALFRRNDFLRVFPVSCARFKSVKPDDFTILKGMKLQRFEQRYGKRAATLPRIELLQNVCENMDMSLVRKRQPLLYHLRINMLFQRVNYMSSMNVPARDKRREIKRRPPVIFLVESKSRPQKFDFLRGVIRQKDNSTVSGETIYHLLHPFSPKAATYNTIEIAKHINEQLGYEKVPQCLNMVMSWIPCFLLSNYEQLDEKFIRMHKYELPEGYDIDRHTNYIYPPILASNHTLNPRLFTNTADNELAQDIPPLTVSSILDYSYPIHHGRGTPESLSSFLHRAEKQELKWKYIKPT